MPSGDPIAISVRDLHKSFRHVRALCGLSFDVGRREIFGLVGPDGAGKTTAMRIVAGVLEPGEGAVSVDGIDVVTDPEGVKRRIGYLSQRFGMYGDLTVQENLDFFSDLYEIPRDIAARRGEELLRMTGLYEFRSRLADALSGGMKQKLALSCTLVHRPSVLLLDEPTTGVDPVSRRDFWRLLYGLPAEGVSIVVSTPYMDEASRCGRVGFVMGGRLLAQATPDELSREAGVVFGVTVEDLRAARAALRAQPGVLSAEAFGGMLHVYPGRPDLRPEDVIALLASAGLPGASVVSVPAGMEDAFIRLIANSEAVHGA